MLHDVVRPRHEVVTDPVGHSFHIDAPRVRGEIKGGSQTVSRDHCAALLEKIAVFLEKSGGAPELAVEIRSILGSGRPLGQFSTDEVHDLLRELAPELKGAVHHGVKAQAPGARELYDTLSRTLGTLIVPIGRVLGSE